MHLRFSKYLPERISCCITIACWSCNGCQFHWNTEQIDSSATFGFNYLENLRNFDWNIKRNNEIKHKTMYSGITTFQTSHIFFQISPYEELNSATYNHVPQHMVLHNRNQMTVILIVLINCHCSNFYATCALKYVWAIMTKLFKWLMIINQHTCNKDNCMTKKLKSWQHTVPDLTIVSNTNLSFHSTNGNWIEKWYVQAIKQ